MKRFLPLFMLTGLLFGQGVEFNIIEIPNSELVDNTTIPSLYNGTIAWHDGTYDGALYYWDGDTTSLVGSGCFGNLSLYDGKIAFQHNEGVNNGTRVYYWDGSTTEIIEEYLWANWLSLYNGEIAFSGSFPDGSGNELHYWTGTSTVQLTNGSCEDWEAFIPSLFDGAIAYLNCHVLYYWDGDTTTTLIYDDSFVHWKPSLYNGEIAFAANDGDDFEIYLWDGTNIIQITDNNVDDKHPSLYDGKIAWRNGNSDETYEIFYWNGTNTFQVTNNDIYDGHPSLYGGNIAWNGGSGWLGTGKIYYALQVNSPWYVSTTGSDETGDGTEENPFATIQHGINAASDGDTVLVSSGTYIENVDIQSKQLVIYSTFGITGDTSDISQTIIDGNNSNNTIHMNNVTGLLKGFTIINGSDEYGGGIEIISSDVELSNLIVRNNNCANGGGGGIYGFQSNVDINNVFVFNNNSGDVGGGVYFKNNCIVNINNSKISDNQSNGSGAGAFLRDTSIININNTIINNNSSNNTSPVVEAA